MTAPHNPYAQPQPQPTTAPVNPYAQPQPAPANPYAQPAPAQPQPNPYAQQPAPAPAPAQQYAQPLPQPAPVQQYAQPAATTAPAPQAPAPQAAGGDPFGDPAPQISRPRPRDLHGRLLLIRPIKVEQVNQKQDDGSYQMQDRMTADVIVLDGGPLQYGGQPEKLGGRPHDKVVEVPYRIESMFISAVGIISQSREALARRMQGQPGMVLGRLTTGEAKSEKHNPPYLLQAATDAEKGIARQYLATVDPFA